MSVAIDSAPTSPIKAGSGWDRFRLARNTFWTVLCVGCSFLTLVPLFSIVYLVVVNGLPLLSPNIFAQLPPAPGLEGGGFGNAVQGTVVMVGIGILFAAPLGILSAIYICEYNRRSSLAGTVRFIAKLLTGLMLAVGRAAGEIAHVLFTARFSQYWIQSFNDETASLAVLIYNFSTLPYDYQIKLAWTASLVLVVLVTMTNITAQLVFSKRRR